MFLWWGEDLIQIYNDAYRPSLGNEGKHPTALGQKGEDCWPEIWPTIKPMIDRVRAGEATWSEDQLIPIYRNGKLENVYWTFGYSPVNDESGNVGGVLVVCNETTEKVTNLQKLEESKAKLAFAIEAAELATWDFNPLTNTFTADDRYTEWFGLTAKEATDNNLALATIADEDREKVRTVLAETLQPNSSGRFDVEYMIRPKNGPERILRAKGKALFDNNGIATRLTGTLQDITRQVLNHRKIEESENQFRSLIEETPVATALYLGKDFVIRYANNIMLGYWNKDNSVIGKTFCEALPEFHTQHFASSLKTVFETGVPYIGVRESSDVLVNDRLQSFYFNFTCKPLRNSNNEIYGIHHTAIDVTKEVLAQIQIEEQEKNLRNIVLQAPVAMCILRSDRFVVDIANEKMFELWGESADNVLTRPIFDALPSMKSQGYDKILSDVFVTGHPYCADEFPLTLPRRGALEKVFVNFAFEPIHEADTSISGIIVVATDITTQVLARKKIEESEAELQQRVEERTKELAAANEELKRSNSHLQEFAHAASHDLKEPIRKIRFFTDRLKTQLADKLSVDDRKMFGRVEHAGIRMNSLIDDLLLYSHVSQKPVEKEPLDLNVKIEKVLEDLELEIEKKQALISVNKLPVVYGYRRQLQQLFYNLLTNALKYVRPDVAPKITISANVVDGDVPGLEPERKYHEIAVSDNGIGFDQEQSERIFQMFQRLHGKAEYEGTGVGLSIAKKVVENHDGKIIAEGKRGEGAVFKFYLPV